ncbi:hypothetical protein C8R47DRAFT_1146615 [Mycena vitilis]|nr:hypothetical protein C8R47DRAFT_1170515 [Mycena vitilis]KAJ6467164.1 hypothetical protein C8R47DRAFT_1152858 [Mycena vitilis]KAJ6472126.1 hypothetical protein C8R47DRAFT_1146615 [Mycena vitilis]
MPFETLEHKRPYFFVPGMGGPNSAVLSEHTSFLLKPLIDQSKRVNWDPCAARVFAPVGWNRDEHEHETAWILKGAKPHCDGIYVNSQEKDAACLPNTKVTAKENLAGALFAHWVFCQVTHEHCLQANMLRRSEAGHIFEEDSVEYMDMGWRVEAFFADEGTLDSLMSAPSRAAFELDPDRDDY